VISVTERAVLIGRVRQIACRTAAAYLDQRHPKPAEADAGEQNLAEAGKKI
jgi:glycyl-tRNA synthetase alpha subunit